MRDGSSQRRSFCRMSGIIISTRRLMWWMFWCAVSAVKWIKITVGNISKLFGVWGMSFAACRRMRHTLSFRLTLWYSGLFFLSTMILFGVTYLLLARSLQRRDYKE